MSGALAAALLLFCGTARAGSPEAAALLRKYEELYRPRTLGTLQCIIDESIPEQRLRLVREGMLYFGGPERFVMVVTKPKTEAGAGYLRLGKNLWSYDAKLGRWERRTEREALGGTNLRRSDMTTAVWSDLYDADSLTTDTINSNPMQKLTLVAKPGVDAPFPRKDIWLDKNLFILKSQDFSASGKLLRTTLTTKQTTFVDKALKRSLPVAKELRVYDELVKGKVTTVVLESFKEGEVSDEIFTKAWFEGQSR